MVIGASLSAFAGAYVGAKVLKKVTLRSVQLVVSALLMVVGGGLIAGLCDHAIIRRILLPLGSNPS